MERVVEAIRRKPWGAELLVAGDFNVNIAAPEGDWRAEDIATELATAGSEDMAGHFLPREKRCCRDRRTWGMRRKVQEVQSRTDYILGTDRRLFRNVTVRYPRHNSEHYMVLVCLPSTPLSETKRYLGGAKAVAGEATGKTITYGQTLCSSTESRTEAETAGGETKRLDLGRDVEAHRRENLRALGPAVWEGGQEADGESGASEFVSGPTEEGGRGGGRCGGSVEGGTTLLG